MNASAATLAERIIGRRLDSPEVEAELQVVDASASPELEDGSLDWLSEKAGLEISADPGTGRITTVFMYSAAMYDDYGQFSGALPRRVQFEKSRAQIKKLLKTPIMSGDKHDAWEFEDFTLIVNYNDAGQIATVTLTTE